MDLYNFFSEVVAKKDEEIIELYLDLKKVCDFVELIDVCDGKNILGACLIGQVWGDDTAVGYTTIFDIFYSAGVKFKWFNAYVW
jgi:hypothetical protein